MKINIILNNGNKYNSRKEFNNSIHTCETCYEYTNTYCRCYIKCSTSDNCYYMFSGIKDIEISTEE